jgi:amino acid adenylation domain-containing protein/thioester reductase-like protein
MLLEQFESVCATAPDLLAVVAEDESLSYRELRRRSRALARRLVEAGLTEGSLVAIYTSRTADTIVGILGAMTAGAAYTVVETDGNPIENLNRLRAIDPRAVLCHAPQADALRAAGLPAMALRRAGEEAVEEGAGDPPPLPSPASRVAYVLFTSGSTGKPKGVAVTHGNVGHYTASIARLLGIGHPLRYAHVSTLAADLGNTSLFLSLATGGTLHLVGAALRKDPHGMREYLIRHRIQFLKITPTHWNAIFAGEEAAAAGGLDLTHLVLGGEMLPKGLARRILESGVARVLVNHYGPTETTVGVVANVLTSPEQVDAIASDAVPIGRPLGETTLLVRTEAGEFSARGATGELYIGGPSVAAGYVGDEQATRDRFACLDAAGNSAGRFYRTGDQASIDDAGVVRFLGRVDRQVKVNGHRVELEHVESVMRTVPGIADAAAFLVEIRGRGRIVAAAQVAGAFDEAGTKDRLGTLLAEYMIPRTILPFPSFPRNDNGKADLKALRQAVLSRLPGGDAAEDRAGAGSAEAAERPPAAGLADEIRALWRNYMQGQPFDDDESFFAGGADSLDAIQLIAELQANGHPVTARAFLENPTVNGLIAAIGNPAPRPTAPPDRRERSESRRFSAAQDFFLRQGLDEPDHHNQAVLLSCGGKVDIEVLREAINALIEHHPMLRAAFARGPDGWAARFNDRGVTLLGMTFIPEERTEHAIQQHIERESANVQASLSLANGRLFRAHLFKFESLPDQLLLVAHHLAVDVISWRVLIAELSRLYSDIGSGGGSSLHRGATSFWDWVEHIDRHAEPLRGRAAPWLRDLRARYGAPPPPDPGNTEGAATTLWFGLSEPETKALSRDAAPGTNAPLHAVLLAALARAVGRWRGAPAVTVPTVTVDVESHGRVVLDDTIDVSRVVGWHTSTFPVCVDVSDPLLATSIPKLTEALGAIPDLGVAYAVAEDAPGPGRPGWPSSEVCFNYIGEIDFAHDQRFPLRASPYSVGRARAAANARGHRLKFTARIVAGRLVADLSFPRDADGDAMRELMRSVGQELRHLLGRDAAPPLLVEEEGTRTGLLTYCPRELLAATDSGGQRPYEAVLLTGATGYVGVHVLREILRQSRAHAYCVVRGNTERHAAERLAEAFEWYFPGEALSSHGHRITVLPGDVTHPGLGVGPKPFEHLAGSVDAIYHFAADTRLFGPQEEFERQNVAPVRTCIELASRGRPKDLHYMSTLAVCGVNGAAEPRVFDEDSMDVGQELQNFYEATKLAAERLVREFHARGGRGFIYRSGNVSGHSETGRFQRNAGDNRLVQHLVACAKVGALPLDLGETLVLSPVDEVARGIVAISLDRATPAGIFHVESDQGIEPDRVFEAMRRSGLPLARSDRPDFARLFMGALDGGDSDVALAYLWSMRKPRNFRLDHSRTHEVLRRLGCRFRRLDDAWLARFVGDLGRRGVFERRPAPSRQDRGDGRFEPRTGLTHAASS